MKPISLCILAALFASTSCAGPAFTGASTMERQPRILDLTPSIEKFDCENGPQVESEEDVVPPPKIASTNPSSMSVIIWDAHTAGSAVDKSSIVAWLDEQSMIISFKVDPPSASSLDWACLEFTRIELAFEELPYSPGVVEIRRSASSGEQVTVLTRSDSQWVPRN